MARHRRVAGVGVINYAIQFPGKGLSGDHLPPAPGVVRARPPPPKLKPGSFPVHESNATSGCRTLLATGNFSESQPYVSGMPITLLEIKKAFGPEDTAAMTAAFEEALKRLNVADREAPMATSVAKKIVRLAKKGECNPTRLIEGVISSFEPIP